MVRTGGREKAGWFCSLSEGLADFLQVETDDLPSATSAGIQPLDCHRNTVVAVTRNSAASSRGVRRWLFIANVSRCFDLFSAGCDEIRLLDRASNSLAGR